MVEKMRSAGVDTAFGLIDWDTNNEPAPDGSIIVLGPDNRYTIENYILDPLLIGALLVREKQDQQIPGLSDILDGIGTWRGLDRASSNTLQKFVDLALGALDAEPDAGDRIDCPLVGGETISLPVWFCHTPGHRLYGLWTAAVPFLQSYGGEEALKREILRRVVADVPGLLSVDLLNLMKQLATHRVTRS
jgi:hypothetical protein